METQLKTVDSLVVSLETLFAEKFDVDFYQREYVWQRKNIEDLVNDLSSEFLKCWRPEHDFKDTAKYDPYYMGEIVLSVKGDDRNSIIDGQQRITSLTLLLIFLLRKFGHVKKFPTQISTLISSDHYGEDMFNLDIPERRTCMNALKNDGAYSVKDGEPPSVSNLVNRYNDFEECWNEEITEENAVHFAYWLMKKVVFSKVWTNSDDFAYVIFETMNDRGLSLTQIEMLRSFLLANIDDDNTKDENRSKALEKYDNLIKRLSLITLSSNSKAEFDFFKTFLRSHYAQDMSQSKGSTSDFVRIGKEFHRWVRDNNMALGLKSSKDFFDFITRLDYFSKIYEKINSLIQQRKTDEYLYLIVNSDYCFTLQPALILASINYQDEDNVVEQKIKIVSKYLTKVLSWRVWNHSVISQSSMEAKIYDLCKSIRGMNSDELKTFLGTDPIEKITLSGFPTLNQQNKRKIKVLISLITEIVAKESGQPSYMLNQDGVEVEHIWCDHIEQHQDECLTAADFSTARNTIGDLLVLPKSFNASYGDDSYSDKLVHYIEQNVLAQSLHKNKYENNPGFVKFIEKSGLPFEAYDDFKKEQITKRSELYKKILEWNWR